MLKTKTQLKPEAMHGQEKKINSFFAEKKKCISVALDGFDTTPSAMSEQ